MSRRKEARPIAKYAKGDELVYKGHPCTVTYVWFDGNFNIWRYILRVQDDVPVVTNSRTDLNDLQRP